MGLRLLFHISYILNKLLESILFELWLSLKFVDDIVVFCISPTPPEFSLFLSFYMKVELFWAMIKTRYGQLNTHSPKVAHCMIRYGVMLSSDLCQSVYNWHRTLGSWALFIHYEHLKFCYFSKFLSRKLIKEVKEIVIDLSTFKEFSDALRNNGKVWCGNFCLKARQLSWVI